MKKEFNIGLECAESCIIVMQKYNDDDVSLVEFIEDDYKKLIDKLGNILWSQFKDFYSDKIKITIKVEEQ